MDETDKPNSQTRPMSNRGEVWDSIPLEAIFDLETGLTYWHPWQGENSTHSVDMVRLALKIDPLGDEDAGSHAAEWWYNHSDADLVDYWPSIKPNQFQSVFTLYWGTWTETATGRAFNKHDAVSMTVGIGWIGPTGKRSPYTGFVEFNPNKVGQFAMDNLRAFLSHYKARLHLERWDYAVDVPEDRSRVLMAKDGRNYESYIGRSVTTYLGKRNQVGRVKVYDKTAESALDVPLTRIEVTYGRPALTPDGGPQLPSAALWPLVGRAASTASAAATTETGQALLTALMQLHELGQDVQPYLQTITDPKTRAKYKRLLVPEPVKFNPTAWTWCALSAMRWEDPDQWAQLMVK